MKTLKKFILGIFTLLITLPAFAQWHSQILVTESGKAAMVYITKSKLKLNVFEIDVRVEWVNENLKKIDDYSSKLVLDKDDIEIKQANAYITCESFDLTNRIYFNKSKTFKFRVSENYDGGMPKVILPFEYAMGEDTETTKFLLKQPNLLKISYTIFKNQIIRLPKLTINYNSLTDKNFNNSIDANEQVKLNFSISNNGKGKAQNVKLKIKENNLMKGLNFAPQYDIGDINAGETKRIAIPVKASKTLKSSHARFTINVYENYGLKIPTITKEINTNAIAPPTLSWLTPTEDFTNSQIKSYPISLCANSKSEITNVWVYANDILQSNTRGFKYKNKNLCNYAIERNIILKEGNNTIKVIVENVGGRTVSKIKTINFSDIIVVDSNRYALVIGNGDYEKTSKLKNPVNDAIAMSIALRQVGFTVMEYTNVSRAEMIKAAREFGILLDKNKGTGLLYYAGHGLQVNSENYLIPTNADIQKEQDVELEAVSLKRFLGEMENADNNMNIVILDACRDNPYAQNFRSTGNNGLAQTKAPNGTYIAYATAPGSVAIDGNGENGLYTEELLKAIRTPGLKIEDVFKKVRNNVYKRSEKIQTPWDNSSIFIDFYFVK